MKTLTAGEATSSRSRSLIFTDITLPDDSPLCKPSLFLLKQPSLLPPIIYVFPFLKAPSLCFTIYFISFEAYNDEEVPVFIVLSLPIARVLDLPSPPKPFTSLLSLYNLYFSFNFLPDYMFCSTTFRED